MQSAHAEALSITPEEYLEGEKVAEFRHEYIDGEIFAMAGGSDAHARISFNAAALLKTQLRGSGCSVYLHEMKVQTDSTKYFYPDILVTCDADDRQRNYRKKSPILIIEVLSESTEAYDRGKKFEYYRQLESLREYVLLDQSEHHADIFRKNAQQRWELFSFIGADTELCFQSVEVCVRMAELYEDVNFDLARADRE